MNKSQWKSPRVLDVYFGVPGSGKTTFASWLSKRSLKHNEKVYSNVPILGTYHITKEDLGISDISNGKLIIDEVGVEFNSRNFKTFSDDARYFFKFHRHYDLSVDVFSQGYDDMDKTIRTLAQHLYVVKKSIFPYFIVRRQIQKRIGINEDTKQIQDEYFWTPFSRKYIFSPPLWKMFDTCERKELPRKDFPMW